MFFRIDSKIFDKYPDLKVGVIIIRGFDNNKRVSAVSSLLRGVCAQKAKEFANKELEDDSMVKVWNQAYSQFGVNPKKNMPSIAALLKRLKSGKELPEINLLVDLYNYFSLKYMLPIGAEDLDWLCGDLKLTFTQGGEAFRPMGSLEVDTAEPGEVAYMDQGGITCRYWNHRECERTKLTKKTVNAAIIIEDLSRMHQDQFSKILMEIQEAVIKYVGGRIEPYILNENGNLIDLHVEGRKKADDSKIPQQEKAFLLGKKAPAQETPKVLKPEIQTIHLEHKDLFKFQIREIVAESLKKAFDLEEKIKIEYPSSSDHGDYACNIAMQLSKQLGQNPREIAQKIIDNISENSLIKKVEIAGPGFINFFLNDEVLNQELEKCLSEAENYGTVNVGENKTMIFEYSSLNIAKPFAAHHLLTTVIGQSLYNIYKKLQFNAVSINHLGDWGTQFGKLLYAFKNWGSKEVVNKDPIAELLKLYVKFHDESEKNPELEDFARAEFKKLEEGDSENRGLWQWFVDESMTQLNKTYEKLKGIHFDHIQGESFYEDKTTALLEEGKKLGIFVEGEEGAYVVHYEDPNVPPFVVQKKDGATLYSTRDFAALKYRIDTFHPEKIIYVVDTAQSLHFKQLFTAAKRFPWYNDEGVHVSFGRMSLKDGKMSTRKGVLIEGEEVIDEGIRRAAETIKEKNPDLANAAEVARIIGVGAIKYSILSQNRATDIVFDWDKMLSLDGNSAPYLQYTYARSRSILRKANDAQSEAIEENKEATSEKTQALLRLIPKFKENLLLSAEEFKPNLLSNYLYELAQKFNAFYNTVPVLKAAESDRESRLKIVNSVGHILKNGLSLLGVEVSEEM